MAIEFKKTEDDILTELLNTANEYGIIRTDRFIGSVSNSIAAAYGDALNSIYDLETQMRRDTATGDWLEQHASLLGETRKSPEEGIDNSYNNVYLQPENGVTLSEYTIGGEPVIIPSGTSVVTDKGTKVLELTDNIYLNTNKVYTRVRIPYGVSTSVLPGKYYLDYELNPMSVGLITEKARLPKIEVIVQKLIQGKTIDIGDEELRSIIDGKAKSFKRSNDYIITVLYRIPNIARVVKKDFNAGSSSVSIFVEPIDGYLSDSMTILIREVISEYVPEGTVIHIGRMVASLFEASIGIKLKPTVDNNSRYEIYTSVKMSGVNYFNNMASGSKFDMDSWISNILTNNTDIEHIKVNRFKINGNKVLVSSYNLSDIEYLYTTIDMIEVVEI